VYPASALAGFLRALDVPGADRLVDVAELAATYRTALADRRTLVLLDNASSAEQVRPLLPGGRSSIAVVTSRDSLAGLVARNGAPRIDLDVLPEAEAVALLHALVGPQVDAEPEATARPS
jgi:hypothetical protein